MININPDFRFVFLSVGICQKLYSQFLNTEHEVSAGLISIALKIYKVYCLRDVFLPKVWTKVMTWTIWWIYIFFLHRSFDTFQRIEFSCHPPHLLNLYCNPLLFSHFSFIPPLSPTFLNTDLLFLVHIDQKSRTKPTSVGGSWVAAAWSWSCLEWHGPQLVSIGAPLVEHFALFSLCFTEKGFLKVRAHSVKQVLSASFGNNNRMSPKVTPV